MNALDDNRYTQTLTSIGQSLERPRAILMVSAHWMTEGKTLVSEALAPKTIHDFGGFPQALFDVQYPAAGSPETAKLIKAFVHSPNIAGDQESWGLDHGTWSVLKHLYPKADIPVLQLSLDMSKPPQYHFEIGQQLSKLRDSGVLILGSGNIVHNLRAIRWTPGATAHDWASEFDHWSKIKLEQKDFKALLTDYHKTEAGRLSVPTMDHYLPLAYILGASDTKDELQFEFEEMQMGSMSMRSFSFGRV